MDDIVMVWLIFHSWLSDAHQDVYKARARKMDLLPSPGNNNNNNNAPLALRERHHVYYRFTVLSKADLSPPFSAVGIYDDKQFTHYSNEVKNWIRVNLTEYDGIKPLPEPEDPRDWYKDLLRTLSNCPHSQCSGECDALLLSTIRHVVKLNISFYHKCELEKLPNGTTKSLSVFDEYGFDGEDFISFNSDTMKWIDKNPKAKEIKEEWDLQTERNQYIKDFLKNCMNCISTFNNTNMSSPDVHVSVRKSPDDDSKLVLTCLATGFYPRDVQMNIRLNRNILEDQTSSGIRPNDDETFQMRISVKINCNHEGSYDCLLIHSSLTEPVSVVWDGKCSNCESEPRWHVGAVAGVVLLLTVIVIVICFICKRKRSNGGTRSCSYGSIDDRSQNEPYRL